jgi:hypothetical protein
VQLDVNKAQRRRPPADVSKLQERLRELTSHLVDSGVIEGIMRERARLYSLARTHFPELLNAAPGAAWSSNPDVSCGLVRTHTHTHVHVCK